MTIKHWHLALAVCLGIGSVLAVLGFNSPAQALSEVKTLTYANSAKISEHDTKLATIETRLLYIADGIDELRGRKRRGP